MAEFIFLLTVQLLSKWLTSNSMRCLRDRVRRITYLANVSALFFLSLSLSLFFFYFRSPPLLPSTFDFSPFKYNWLTACNVEIQLPLIQRSSTSRLLINTRTTTVFPTMFLANGHTRGKKHTQRGMSPRRNEAWVHPFENVQFVAIISLVRICFFFLFSSLPPLSPPPPSSLPSSPLASSSSSPSSRIWKKFVITQVR